MRIFRSTAMIFLLTVLALIYVHQQIELVKLSYAIDSKEKRLKDMLDHNESLGYNIDNLESPARLEDALTAKNIEIAFPKRSNVVKIAKVTATMRGSFDKQRLGEDRAFHLTRIFDFFGKGAEAQAREK